MLSERQAFGDLPAITTVDQHDGLALPFYEARAQRIGKAVAILVRNGQTIYDN